MFDTITDEDLIYFTIKPRLLLVTATDIETSALHALMCPLTDKHKLSRYWKGTHTYYVGTLGSYEVIQVQCGTMGSATLGASHQTVSDAIDTWNVAAIVMCGIAFGVDSKKQKIGDLLVAESIIPYANWKLTPDRDIYRGRNAQANPILLDRFLSKLDWRYLTSDGNIPSITKTAMLSGEILLNDIEVRDRLLESFPEAKGGEMEGIGLATAASAKSVPWILVKSICDYADGNKDVDKDQRQETAARVSAEFVKLVLSQIGILDELGCAKNGTTKSPGHSVQEERMEAKVPDNLRQILFEIYGHDCEPYYCPRRFDETIMAITGHRSFWIHGRTGSGKTSIIRRTLLRANCQFLYISLANCLSTSPAEALTEIAIQLSTYFRVVGNIPKKESASETIKRISNILSTSISKGPFYVYVDEIPVDDTKDFELFVKAMIGLVVFYRNQNPNSELHFAFSSISDPVAHIANKDKRVFSLIDFHKIPLWEEVEIKSLVELLVPLLSLKLPPEKVLSLSSFPQFGPRLPKVTLNKFIIYGEQNINSLEMFLMDTKGDLE